jgi:AraC-like DNA-binding protein
MKDWVVYSAFDDYYIDTKAKVRTGHQDFHVFRINELGDQLVERMGPFKTEYYQFAVGSNLRARVSIYEKDFIAEDYFMVIFIPGQVIRWEKDGEWDGYVINVRDEFLSNTFFELEVNGKNQLEPLQPLVLALTLEEYTVFSNLNELMIEEYKSLREENIQVIKHLMHVFIVYVNRIVSNKSIGSEKKDVFYHIKNYDIAKLYKQLVLKHYTQEKSVAFYAKELGISSDQLNKQVRQILNKSPKEFINEVLIVHAKSILRDSNSSIKELSYDLNFQDYSHFVKFFKKMTGMSPAEYQKKSL